MHGTSVKGIVPKTSSLVQGVLAFSFEIDQAQAWSTVEFGKALLRKAPRPFPPHGPSGSPLFYPKPKAPNGLSNWPHRALQGLACGDHQSLGQRTT